MTCRSRCAALLAALLLGGCGSLPPAAIGAVAGAAAAAFRLDDDVLRLVSGRGSTPEKGSIIMSAITIPTDGVFNIPLLFKDQVGNTVAPPAGGTVATDNTAVATASLSTDGSTVTVTPVAVGSCNLNYSNGPLTATSPVTVTSPIAASVAFGQGAAASK
jgi:hypothetical protein